MRTYRTATDSQKLDESRALTFLFIVKGELMKLFDRLFERQLQEAMDEVSNDNVNKRKLQKQ